MKKISEESAIRITEELVIKHIRDGEVIDVDEFIDDLVVNAGLTWLAKLVNGTETNFFEYIAIGTGTTAPAAGDTTLEAEITTGGGERASATTSYEADYKAKWVHTFNFTATFAVTEAGILDSAVGGNLLCRNTFTAKNVENGDSLEITYKLTISTS